MEIKKIEIGENLLVENEKIAKENSEILKGKNIVSVNLMGPPGSGKTKILERTISMIKDEIPCGVIEGDIAGLYDSERLRPLNIPIVQINTGGACHLEALMVKKGLENLPLDEIRLLFIENVGNLVCPAEFSLGVDKNVVVVSVTDGEDKPAKYPLMFKISEVCILNKVDLLKNLEFDADLFEKNLLRTNESIKLMKISSLTGENFSQWINYIRKLVKF
ncbi:MAG: hydrogenase accessory protein HypB [Candidatus Omnitrophota bacterium]|nr:MAG: hydrogenase accessory protein HypB [Candidatus Omnitrophota bacterium]